MTLKVALAAPVVEGLKTTLKTHFPEAASEDPQVVVLLNSERLVPVTEPAPTATELDVPFVMVMVCAALVEPRATLPNDRLEGVTVTLPEVPPLQEPPQRETFCGLFVAPSFIVSDAVRVPVTVGLKRTVTVQLEFAAIDFPAAHVVVVV